MKIVFSKEYTANNRRHVFRTDKFSAVLKLLLKKSLITKKEIIEPKPPSRADLLLAHTPVWVDKNLRFKFTPRDSARAELEITRGVARAHLMNVGGTIAAARLALETGQGRELFFFPRLRAELQRHLQQAPRVVRFRGLRGCVKQLTGARRWSRRCETLELEIVDYLRQCLGAESGPVEFSLLVE